MHQLRARVVETCHVGTSQRRGHDEGVRTRPTATARPTLVLMHAAAIVDSQVKTMLGAGLASVRSSVTGLRLTCGARAHHPVRHPRRIPRASVERRGYAGGGCSHDAPWAGRRGTNGFQLHPPDNHTQLPQQDHVLSPRALRAHFAPPPSSERGR